MARKKNLDTLAAAIESLSYEGAGRLAARFNREAAALIRESPGRAVSADAYTQFARPSASAEG